jgi:hypothetical protein
VLAKYVDVMDSALACWPLPMRMDVLGNGWVEEREVWRREKKRVCFEEVKSMREGSVKRREKRRTEGGCPKRCDVASSRVTLMLRLSFKIDCPCQFICRYIQ